jgi:hypothetical protein
MGPAAQEAHRDTATSRPPRWKQPQVGGSHGAVFLYDLSQAGADVFQGELHAILADAFLSASAGLLGVAR